MIPEHKASSLATETSIPYPTPALDLDLARSYHAPITTPNRGVILVKYLHPPTVSEVEILKGARPSIGTVGGNVPRALEHGWHSSSPIVVLRNFKARVTKHGALLIIWVVALVGRGPRKIPKLNVTLGTFAVQEDLCRARRWEPSMGKKGVTIQRRVERISHRSRWIYDGNVRSFAGRAGKVKSRERNVNNVVDLIFEIRR
mmetsp:Transcript_8426/g.15320  ORF Transcript_8426/g.15320 Transcript_8426/m.15320 type:complete len:201 (+) Transcript_8426:3371-3973(+)